MDSVLQRILVDQHFICFRIWQWEKVGAHDTVSWVIKEVQITPPTVVLLDLLTFCADFLFSDGSYVKSCLVVSSVIWTSCLRLTCSCMTTISQEDNVSKVSLMLFYCFAAIFLILYCLLFLPSVFFVKSLLKFNEGTTNWYFTSDGQILKNVHIFYSLTMRKE